MENKQRVFIRGVEGRGDEVRQALINLGGKNVHDFCYGDTGGLFFINHNGEIKYASEFSEMGKIIMDCYTELHLPEKWKDGDLLVSQAFFAKSYVVYSDDSELIKGDTIITYVNVDKHIYGINTLFNKEDFKLASDEEHKEFHELLHEHGKDWDAEKKKIVDWKWRPKTDERYWFVSSSGRIIDYGWTDSPANKAGFDFGNCFRTKEEAEAAAERVKKALKGE